MNSKDKKELSKFLLKEIEDFLSGHDKTMDYNFRLSKDNKSVKVYERTGYEEDESGKPVLNSDGSWVEKKPKYIFSIGIIL